MKIVFFILKEFFIYPIRTRKDLSMKKSKVNYSQCFLVTLSLSLLFPLLGCSVPLPVQLNKHENHYSSDLNPNKGEVYTYREKEFQACMRGLYIKANGKRVGALNNGTYFVYLADPGKNTFSIENNLGDEPTRIFDIEAGKKYYLCGKIKMGFWDADPYLTIVNENEGKNAIMSLVYATVDK